MPGPEPHPAAPSPRKSPPALTPTRGQCHLGHTGIVPWPQLLPFWEKTLPRCHHLPSWPHPSRPAGLPWKTELQSAQTQRLPGLASPCLTHQPTRIYQQCPGSVHWWICADPEIRAQSPVAKARLAAWTRQHRFVPWLECNLPQGLGFQGWRPGLLGSAPTLDFSPLHPDGFCPP